MNKANRHKLHAHAILLTHTHGYWLICLDTCAYASSQVCVLERSHPCLCPCTLASLHGYIPTHLHLCTFTSFYVRHIDLFFLFSRILKNMRKWNMGQADHLAYRKFDQMKQKMRRNYQNYFLSSMKY